MAFNKYYAMTSNDYYQNGRDCMDIADWENAVENFIELRNNGTKWYNIETVANDLNIQSHFMVSMRDRLVFPLKPSSKTGRKLDF